jgi:hypothetical protein
MQKTESRIRINNVVSQKFETSKEMIEKVQNWISAILPGKHTKVWAV